MKWVAVFNVFQDIILSNEIEIWEDNFFLKKIIIIFILMISVL